MGAARAARGPRARTVITRTGLNSSLHLIAWFGVPLAINSVANRHLFALETAA